MSFPKSKKIDGEIYYRSPIGGVGRTKANVKKSIASKKLSSCKRAGFKCRIIRDPKTGKGWIYSRKK